MNHGFARRSCLVLWALSLLLAIESIADGHPMAAVTCFAVSYLMCIADRVGRRS